MPCTLSRVLPGIAKRAGIAETAVRDNLAAVCGDTGAAHPLLLLVFGLLGGGLLATCGLLAGIWADKFDQVATVQNFVILPLTYLSGVFYSIHSLPPAWQALSRANPFFYLIDGFRYGFFGHSDVSPWLSVAVMAGANAALCILCQRLLSRGYKLRG
jgi:ABC-2 type transport system permease protein